ncbi:restriction endonuclease [Flavobacterium davisii]|uniref:Restriction endonuclease n=1 Tax=Flavobacterium columnare TaxID=996 RepID=A0A8G0KY64_9FLAO|nr:restriction endonuclease [Flavobacterium davisii]QYS89755.1 restriction endonuclease [Flavobacterium davisii]
MWKEYEIQIFDFLKEIYPECEIDYDDSIYGIYSKVERQIDFAIRGDLAGNRVLGIVDCKYYKKNIDVKVVESFIGMMEDVKANFGFMVTNKGYSPAAKNRVKNSNLRLDVLKLNEMKQVELTIDYFFNQKIYGLQLSKSEFFKRNKHNSGYFDEVKSNYVKREIYFKEGFVRSEYYAFKKILEYSVRIFRDFEQLEKVKLYVPLAQNNCSDESFVGSCIYKCEISRFEIESFCKLK